MTALTDALAAAQSRAIGAVSKAYVAGRIDRETADNHLQEVGATDEVDRLALLDALTTIQAYGAQAPSEAQAKENGGKQTASEAQRQYLRDLVTRANDQAPTEWIGYLTKDEAHEAIEQIKAGKFNIDDWQVPF